MGRDRPTHTERERENERDRQGEVRTSTKKKKAGTNHRFHRNTNGPSIDEERNHTVRGSSAARGTVRKGWGWSRKSRRGVRHPPLPSRENRGEAVETDLCRRGIVRVEYERPRGQRKGSFVPRPRWRSRSIGSMRSTTWFRFLRSGKGVFVSEFGRRSMDG